MDDDLGVPEALAVVFDAVREGNKLLAAGDSSDLRANLASVRHMLGVLGLDPLGEPWAEMGDGVFGTARLNGVVDSLVTSLLRRRDEARRLHLVGPVALVGALHLLHRDHLARGAGEEVHPPAVGRLDCHIDPGHVDGVGEVRSIEPEGDGRRIRVGVPESLSRYLVEKGSVTVDGVSLTVADVNGSEIEIALIPHSVEVTTLGLRTVGEKVNLEIDVLAKYVEKLLRPDS